VTITKSGFPVNVYESADRDPL